MKVDLKHWKAVAAALGVVFMFAWNLSIDTHEDKLRLCEQYAEAQQTICTNTKLYLADRVTALEEQLEQVQAALLRRVLSDSFSPITGATDAEP